MAHTPIRLLRLARWRALARAVSVATVCCVAPDLAAAESVVIISTKDCARLVAHQAAADVTYTPGIDVQGRAVAPADLPGSVSLAVPDEIAIDITVEIQKRFGIPNNAALFKPEARIGTVVVRADGGATFNGQPLTSPEQQALTALCQKQGVPAR